MNKIVLFIGLMGLSACSSLSPKQQEVVKEASVSFTELCEKLDFEEIERVITLICLSSEF